MAKEKNNATFVAPSFDASSSDDVLSQKLKALEAVKFNCEKKFGTNALIRMDGTDFKKTPMDSSDISGLDDILGGGYGKGRIVEIYGPESSGKTTIALHAIAASQARGQLAAFIDAEHALDPVYASNIGVQMDKLWLSQPDCGEQALEIAEDLVESGAVDIIVIDSVAALTPRAEIEGEMGDSHMGLQARLMSQALRKLTGKLSKTGTKLIFINQLRMKIGVMFGCFSYNTRVCLADGTTEKIGKIVNQKMDIELLSFNKETGLVEPQKIVSYFNNGSSDTFLKFVVEKPYGNGRSQFECTPNHLIFTPYGEENAKNLKEGDSVLSLGKFKLSDTQKKVAYGSLLGDGSISKKGKRLKIAHGKKQNDYCLYKKYIFSNLNPLVYTHMKGGKAFEVPSCEEFIELREMCYSDKGKPQIKESFLSKLTEESIAIWFMDDGSLSGSYSHWGNGKISISVKSYTMEEIEKLRYFLEKNDYGKASISKNKVLIFSGEESGKLQSKIAKWIHPSMRYKLAEKFRDSPFISLIGDATSTVYKMVPRKIISIKEISKSSNKFDLEISNNHNYLVDYVGVHNSPETTTGGNALKFYASQRLDVRRTGTNDGDNDEAVSNTIKVKVVKNKLAPPFRKREFILEFGKGVDKIRDLLSLAVDYNIIDKKGAWYTYGEEKVGQGADNSAKWLSENENFRNEIIEKVKEAIANK